MSAEQDRLIEITTIIESQARSLPAAVGHSDTVTVTL